MNETDDLNNFVYHLTETIGNIKQQSAQKLAGIFLNAMIENGYTIGDTLNGLAAYCFTKKRMAETASLLEKAALSSKEELLLQKQTRTLMEDDSNHD